MNPKSKTLARKFLDELKALTDERAIVLTAHLLCEHWLDELIEKNAIKSKEILNNRQYTFSFRLNFVLNMRLIPLAIEEDLQVLNQIRNCYAHDLDFKINSDKGINYLAKLKPIDGESVNFNEFGSALKSGILSSKDALYWVAFATFGRLHNHCNQMVVNQHQEDLGST